MTQPTPAEQFQQLNVITNMLEDFAPFGNSSTFSAGGSTTRRLVKIKHSRKFNDIVKLSLPIESKDMVSMDQCKDMIELEH